MRTYNTEGIVLRRGDYRENDRLFTILTPTHGKIDVISKGTKKILSKLNPHLEPLSEVKIMVALGKGFDKLANATMLNDQSQIRNSEDIVIRTLSHYLLEITDRLVVGSMIESTIYENLNKVLSHWRDKVEIGQAPGYYYFLANIYGLSLLDSLGYRPQLLRCTECHQGILFPKSTFVFMKGGLVCENCKEITIIHQHFEVSDTVIKMMLSFLDSPYSNSASGLYHPNDMKEFNGMVSRLLEHQIEKPLSTLSFLKTVID